MAKGITDPRSLPEPRPLTEVEREGAGGSETFGARVTPIVRRCYYILGFMFFASCHPLCEQCSAGDKGKN
jgi:hypothetical protein